jgi:hypothetical protein
MSIQIKNAIYRNFKNLTIYLDVRAVYTRATVLADGDVL